MPFPDGGSRYQVSRSGAFFCAWNQDGRELLMVGNDGMVRVADVSPGPPFHASTPRALFRVPGGATQAAAITPDLQRFLISLPEPGAGSPGLVIETGWMK